MSRLRFTVGEIAIYAGLTRNVCHNGTECEIVRVGPFPPGTQASGPTVPDGRFPGTLTTADYEVINHDGYHWFTYDEKLRKRRPPEQPAEQEFQQELRLWLRQGEKERA